MSAVVDCPNCGKVMPADVMVCPACRHTRAAPSAEPEAMTDLALKAGDLFHGRYKLERPLGSGGMASVWVGFDQVLNQQVAIKFLRFDGTEDISEYLTRFRQEIRLARKIADPGIVANYDMGEWQGRPYLTMELVEGTDLSRVIRREHPLPFDRIVKWLIQVGTALQAAHEQNIVHRDLKSSNIIIDHKDDARVLDFGIARGLLDPRQTLSGRVVGTPLYIAPEAAMERPDVDHRSDIYSYGILAYEMCTRTFPFKDRNPVKILLAHIQQKPSPPGYHRPDLPSDIEEVILRCIEKEPPRRYQRIVDAVNDLRRSSAARSASSAASRSASVQSGGALPPKVLVVDDDGVLRLLLKTLFEGAGLAVTVVPDAELAAEKLRTDIFGLLVTDLVLPGKSGHDLAAWVRHLPDGRRPPVVVMTSLEEEAIHQRSNELGVAGHLTKPLSIDEFTQLLKKFFPEYAPKEN